MELSFAFFADHATVPPDGKVYALGGGFTALHLPQLPGQATFAVVAGFRFGAEDVGQVHVVELRLVDVRDRQLLPPSTLQFESVGPMPHPEAKVSISTVTYLSAMFGEPGVYAAQFWRGERLLKALDMTVEEQQPPPELGERPN